LIYNFALVINKRNKYMSTTTVGTFADRASAEEAISLLRKAGVQDSEISCVYSDSSGAVKDTQTGDTVGGSAAKGATVGAVVGGIAGLVVANGILPGIGTLFVAGPLAAALGFTGGAATAVAGAATGLAAGGLLGALTHLGIPDSDAALYETRLHEGSYLVIVQSALNTTRNILESNNSKDVREYQMA
jgi:uncharacterized membrane protein